VGRLGTLNNGVLGEQESGTTSDAAVHGVSTLSNGNGVIGEANEGSAPFGVWGKSTSGYAGYFSGDVYVSGTLYKSAGSFKIDHPLDPANRTLSHSFVESPDMKNVYDGVVELDSLGEARIQLPEWFDALNRDFRYQLTCIGGFAPVYVAEEIIDNAFTIAGGRAGMRVSWQVTGIRHDPWAEANRIQVEEDKTLDERGHYLSPDAYGLPDELSIERARKGAPAKLPAKPTIRTSSDRTEELGRRVR
jgi:hypothetical protein